MTDMIFTYEGLKSFLINAAEYGPVTSFERMNRGNGVILRHDVDFNVRQAFRLAELEKECGVTSTFFFLTTSHLYNIASAENRKILRQMTDDGFEIGLHFDPTLYPDDTAEELEEKAIFEASIIESVTGRKVKSLSLHNPSIHGQYPLFKSFLNAYAPEYFDPENYISDSRMGFRGKVPSEFIKKAASERIQVLLHPFHYSEDGKNYTELMRENVYQFADDLHQCTAANSQYIKEIGGKSLRDIL